MWFIVLKQLRFRLLTFAALGSGNLLEHPFLGLAGSHDLPLLPCNKKKSDNSQGGTK